ncbi:MAG: DUF1638 domain-containing protein [Candidatus Firestonebacteria bacterium]
MAHYKIISCHVLWHELCYYAALSNNKFDFEFLKYSLHLTPEVLRTELQAAIDRSDEGEHSAILLGYGLCSNGTRGITARKKRLVIARGHDCITLLLGSKERYREYFDSHSGTYWYSPGWCENGARPGEDTYNERLTGLVEKYGEDNGKYLFDMENAWYKNYNNAAYVDLGFGDTGPLKDDTKKSAKWLGWTYDELKGDPQLLKNFIEGNWEEKSFLVVEPGQTITASNDERVIKIEGTK